MTIPIDWRRLLEPVSREAPSGANLEYAVEFAALERAAHGRPDQRMGDALVAGDAPDPEAVLVQGSALLARSKDLRVAVLLLRAALAKGGLAEFLAGLAALRELLERFWDTLHPELDPEDGAQATARSNAVLALARPEVLFELQRAAWIELPGFGPVSLDQASTLLRDLSPSSVPTGESARLSMALRQASPERTQDWTATLELGLEQVRGIAALFESHAAATPDLDALQRCLREALALLRAQLPTPLASPAASASEPPPEPSCPPSQGEPRPCPIRDRADVVRTLDEICAYYRDREPSSPLPLLLRRCQRLASLDFLEILQELAPEALPKIDLIRGTGPSTAHTR